jgi:tRNA (cmo5U34)-methyltransferase
MQTAERDEVEPGEKWGFDADVTRVFDDMLQRSIPQYDVMRNACVDLGSLYVQPDTES